MATTPRPRDVDAAEAFRDSVTITVDRRYRKLRRVRLGVWLAKIGFRIAGGWPRVDHE